MPTPLLELIPGIPADRNGCANQSSSKWSAGAGCHGNCGQKLYVKDGKLIKVEGDEDHPWNQGRACPRVLALTQYVYHPDRIYYPLKRVGERGEGKFERISWDEAFDTCEARLKEHP